jgi:hypothetical protein
MAHTLNMYKDHEIAQIVNNLTKIANAYADTQQMRCVISSYMVPVLRGELDKARVPDMNFKRVQRPIVDLHVDVEAFRKAVQEEEQFILTTLSQPKV